MSKRSEGLFSYHGMWLGFPTAGFPTTGVTGCGGAIQTLRRHQIDARVRQWLILQHLQFEVDGVLLFKGRLPKPR